jgi:hypothetical protein
MSRQTRKNQKRPASRANDEIYPSRSLLERGDIFFVYRPDVEQESPDPLLDVRRFHVILRPEGQEILRMITIGRKKLPGGDDDAGNYWAFVDKVFRKPEGLRQALSAATYETQTLGERHLSAARPAGEGVYGLVRHGRNSVLAYELELPEQPGAVQEAFHIEHEGRFLVAIKNPRAAHAPGIGLDESQQAEFPDALLERFGDRKWIAADPPDFLNYEGAELVLMSGRAGALDGLELDLDPQPEDDETADVFRVLKLERSERTIKPLFAGVWE